MSTKTAYLNVRLEPKLKAEAEKVLAALGTTSTAAVTMFYRQVVLRQGLPFDVRLPNAKTAAAMREFDRLSRRQAQKQTAGEPEDRRQGLHRPFADSLKSRRTPPPTRHPSGLVKRRRVEELGSGPRRKRDARSLDQLGAGTQQARHLLQEGVPRCGRQRMGRRLKDGRRVRESVRRIGGMGSGL